MPAYGLGRWGLGEYGVGEEIPEPSFVHPHDSGRQTLPEILLTIPDSNWPMSPGLPIGTGRCDALRLDREIVAASLPGQVRGKTGFSIGDASVTVAQPRGRQFAPWSPSSDRIIGAGDEAELVAWDERSDTRTPLGKWRVAKPAGALTSSQVSVELDESQARGRSLPNRLPTIAGPVDPVWIVDQLARQMGYYSTPKPTALTVLDVPLCGSAAPEVGRLVRGAAGADWTMRLGVVTLDSATTVRPRWEHAPVGTGGSFRFAVSAEGAVIRFMLPTDGGMTSLDFLAWGSGALQMRIDDSATWQGVNFTPGLHADWPTRLEVEVNQSGSTIRARARSTDDDTKWSEWVSVPRGTAQLSPTETEIQFLWGGVAALQVGTGPLSWEPPTARLSLLDGTVHAPWVPATADVWTALQSVTDSWGAIAWTTNDDRLMLLNRHQAAGTGRPKTRIDVDRLAEDIRWSVAADDFADRLEVTWRPVTWPDEFTDPSEWTVADRLHVPAGGSVSVDVDLGGYVQTLAPFEPYATAVVGASEWQANTAADGSGAFVETGVAVAVEHPSPSRARVTVANMTASDVWMVDGSGASGLTLRGTGLATQDQEARITRGAAEVDAKFPLSIDLGYTVQNRVDAEALTSYLWERVNRARWRAESVRLPLDWSRDLGVLLLLDHPRSGLSVNALVTGVHIDTGSAGMTVDLVALPPTWSDFDAAWFGHDGAAFDAAHASRTGVQFDNDPLRTEA